MPDTLWLNNEKTRYILTARGSNKSEVKKKSNDADALFFAIIILAAIWIIIRLRDGRSKSWVEIGSNAAGDEDETVYDPGNEQSQVEMQPYLRYEGSALNFTGTELNAILNKRSPFYTRLNPFEKEKFLKRLKKFISRKTFNIHDNSGFKEMPVLISASAIQLSFGLEYYLLPDFPVINIFPQEFLGVHPNIRFLEGNVSDSSINISWKHFLNGFSIPDDGQNVGLHEMAHAYYYQNLQCRECEDQQFKKIYPSYELTANKVYEQEQKPGYDLYTEYAMKNFQEFWAESVEIFFEKPLVLKTSYPQLYDAMRSLLQQDTAKHS
jgi:Mlc titration factor MtfA (ptsG expression regulator)